MGMDGEDVDVDPGNESIDGDDDEECYQHELRAGELFVMGQGETSEKATSNVKDLWDYALADLENLNPDERENIGLHR